jgi:hypothetical protein
MRGFFDAETYKPSQFHHAECTLIDFLESLQGLVQKQNSSGLWGYHSERVVEFDVNLPAAALSRKICTRVVD